MIEFKDQAVQAEYDMLKVEEDFALDELGRLQTRLREIEDTEEQL